MWMPEEVKQLINDTPKNMAEFRDGMTLLGKKLDETNSLLKHIIQLLEIERIPTNRA